MNEENMRRGKFTLDGEMMRLGEFEFLKRIMDQVVVFHTEARFDRDEITYFAYHPSFDVIAQGDIYPEYEVILSTNTFSVVWRKVE
jgi:hypothetical protein